MSVETLFHFRVGGELKWSLLGALAGALVSVTPFDLWCIWSVAALVLLAWALSPPRSPRLAHLLSVLAFAAIITVAIHAPTKERDRKVQVSAQTMPLSQLARELELGEETSGVWVSLPSVRPTWAEVEAAVSSHTHLRIDKRTCGSGASLLFGAYAYGRHLEAQ